MDQNITPYKESNASKKKQVTQMFDTISGTYDRLNRVISLGIDIKWRKKVVDIIIATNPKRILDVATGTADLAIAIAKKKQAQNTTENKEKNQVIGLDISTGMLEMGKQKVTQEHLEQTVTLEVGDAENIPYPDNYFDAITVSFGVRNFENLDKGLSEIYRVLQPNGIFVILETAVPSKFPFKQGYQLYSKVVLPVVGKIFSKDKKAYSYLSQSASAFPCGEKMNTILQNNQFKDVKDMPQTMGVASIYVARK